MKEAGESELKSYSAEIGDVSFFLVELGKKGKEDVVSG